MNYYEILGVKPTATADEIRAAYLRLCKDLHPDKLPHLNENLRKIAEEQLKVINQAYATLKDETLRAIYDQMIGVQVPSPKPTRATNLTFDELLSSSVLEEGFRDLVKEEERLWRDLTRELYSLRRKHNIKESQSFLELIFPSDLADRLSQIALTMIFLVILLVFPVLLVAFLSFCIVGTFRLICENGELKLSDDVRQKLEKEELIFSRLVQQYWQVSKSFSLSFAIHKVFGRIYPSAYVAEVTKSRRKFDKKLAELLNHRKRIAKLCKDLDPSSLTVEFVSHLSASERLILVRILQQKIHEIKEQTEALVATLIGLVGTAVLISILFGSFGASRRRF
ncbi:MAG: DnaJ domain-containing protein [Gloeomargarita sp. SKYBB_i_bin120]|nr:DnaJ domain-containing protein [Gloeomargarita sp. SKYG98]MCS7293233.1 DnaJ domain-containing protein [Gloeomargarita sp. SKYB120]MDW8178797.1 DnaJ domain-containing protein [Gloeomargarita sp. SKYBB_i_bin120]